MKNERLVVPFALRRRIEGVVRAHVGLWILHGPYKLLQQIGEGGRGVVYMAEQLEPVRRRVASLTRSGSWESIRPGHRPLRGRAGKTQAAERQVHERGRPEERCNRLFVWDQSASGAIPRPLHPTRWRPYGRPAASRIL